MMYLQKLKSTADPLPGEISSQTSECLESHKWFLAMRGLERAPMSMPLSSILNNMLSLRGDMGPLSTQVPGAKPPELESQLRCLLAHCICFLLCGIQTIMTPTHRMSEKMHVNASRALKTVLATQ